MRTHRPALRPFLLYAACLTSAVLPAATVTWDTSTTAGFQSGNGTWGTDAFWSADGLFAGAWTPADSAVFLGGETKVTETITITGAQSIGGLGFGSATTSGDWSFAGTGTLNLAAAATFDVSAGSTVRLADRVVAGGFAITKTGAGKLRMNPGVTTNAMNITVQAGVLEVNGTSTTQVAGLGSVYTVNAGAEMALVGGDIWSQASAPVIVLNQGSKLSLNGNFNRLYNVTFNGGTMDVNGFGAAGGFNSVQLGGTINVNQDSRILASTGVGGIRVFDHITFNVATARTMTVDVNLNQNNTWASVIKNGAGRLDLNGASTHAGGVTINAGTLAIAQNQSLGTGALTFNAGTLMLGNVTVANAMSFRSGTINVADGVSAAWNGVIATAASGTAALNKSGNGQLTLGGANTYTTGTTLTAGTLVLANNAALGTGAVTIIGGVLNLGGRTITNNVTLNGGSLTGGTINLAQATLNAGTVTASLAGSASYTKSGAGVVTLSGNNTYAGNTIVNAGTLVAGSNNAFSTGTVTINAGAALEVASGVSLANNLTLVGSATIAGNAGTLSGVISGSGSMNKTGAGMLTLSGDNTFTGGSVIQAGTLKVDGVMASAVTVNSGARLGGVGRINDVVTVLAGGSLGAGGVDVGTLNLAALEMRGGTTLELKVIDGAGPAGVGFDRFVVIGALDLSAASLANRITLRLSGAPANFGVSSDRVFTFLDYGSLNLGGSTSITDLFTISTDNLLDQNGQPFAAGSFSLVDDFASSRLSIAYTSPIPEPSTYGVSLGALGLAVALFRRRRAQRAL
jgi:autotransporter-associated beta strand protein